MHNAIMNWPGSSSSQIGLDCDLDDDWDDDLNNKHCKFWVTKQIKEGEEEKTSKEHKI